MKYIQCDQGEHRELWISPVDKAAMKCAPEGHLDPLLEMVFLRGTTGYVDEVVVVAIGALILAWVMSYQPQKRITELVLRYHGRC